MFFKKDHPQGKKNTAKKKTMWLIKIKEELFKMADINVGMKVNCISKQEESQGLEALRPCEAVFECDHLTA